MRLKYSKRHPWLYHTYSFVLGKKRRRFLAVLLYTLLIFILGAYVYKSLPLDKIRVILNENVSLISKIIGGRLSTPEHITIDIKHKNFLKLARKREIAMANRILFTSSGDYVPAKIRYKDRTIAVKLRLKGDLGDHWEGKKWSFRVKVKGDNTLFGMKQFSIQHPKTRGYIYEWIYHQALKREGVIYLRYKFIDVTINGKDMGIYALEEHFEKRLIENNELREGPIVRFDEDMVWLEELQQGFVHFRVGKQKSGSGAYLSSSTDVFQTQKWFLDPAKKNHFFKAIYLLESFRSGKLKTRDVFDIPKLARYFAITDLMGAAHGTLWINARFYYNPITSRLEPIGFDARGDESIAIKSLVATKPEIYNPQKDDTYYYWYYHYARLFGDEEFFQEYIKQLERISESSYLDKLFADLEMEMKENLNIIYKEYTAFEFSKKVFYKNQQYIKSVLNPVKGMHAYFHNAFKNGVVLELGNIQPSS